jgi:hypothetical protein
MLTGGWGLEDHNPMYGYFGVFFGDGENFSNAPHKIMHKISESSYQPV